MIVNVGSVGPKARQKCVADGWQVNIPAPRCASDGTQAACRRLPSENAVAMLWGCIGKPVLVLVRTPLGMALKLRRTASGNTPKHHKAHRVRTANRRWWA